MARPTGNPVGRPRESHVPTERGRCEIHGLQEFRLHKNGTNKDGEQKYQRRCPPCHSERNSLLRNVKA